MPEKIRNQMGDITTGSCYLMCSVPGNWTVGTAVANGHQVLEYCVGVSKALVAATNGLRSESGRVVGTVMTFTLGNSASQAQFLAINAEGTTIDKVTIINLINRGDTAVEAFRVELTVVRIVAIRINGKRIIGEKPQNKTMLKIQQDISNELDMDSSEHMQQQNPEARQVDVYEIDLGYQGITFVFTPTEPDGTPGGKVAQSFDFQKNAANAPS